MIIIIDTIFKIWYDIIGSDFFMLVFAGLIAFSFMRGLTKYYIIT